MPKKKGQPPVRRRIAPAKKDSARTIISRWLPDLVLIAVGAFAVAMVIAFYPNATTIEIACSMGGAFIALGVTEMLQ